MAKQYTPEELADLIDSYRKANDYLNKKHIRIAYQHPITLEDLENPTENIMYVAKGDSWKFLDTPVTQTMVDRLKAERLYIAEIPFKGHGVDFDRAIIEAADKVKEMLGSVSLSDVVDIEEASKSEIRKLITRLKKSSPEQIPARKAELEELISLYEDKENDTEREDLAEQWANIRECLEQAQSSLENNKAEDALAELDDALYSV